MGKPTIHLSILIPLLLMAVAFTTYFATVLLMRVRNDILERERHTTWVADVVSDNVDTRAPRSGKRGEGVA